MLDSKKRRMSDKLVESVTDGQECEENCNLIVPDSYSNSTRARVAVMNEKDVDFTVIEASFLLMF